MFKVLNAYEFERHASSKTKHPNNLIYFENGKTIYQIVQELRSTPESLLFDTIQTVFGAPINQKSFRIWKGNENQFVNHCLLLLISLVFVIQDCLLGKWGMGLFESVLFFFPIGSEELYSFCFLFHSSFTSWFRQNHFKQQLGNFSEYMGKTN